MTLPHTTATMQVSAFLYWALHQDRSICILQDPASGHMTSFNNFLGFYQHGREGMLSLPHKDMLLGGWGSILWPLAPKLEVNCLMMELVHISSYVFLQLYTILSFYQVDDLTLFRKWWEIKLCLLYWGSFLHHCLIVSCPDTFMPLIWRYSGSLFTFVISRCLHSQNKGQLGFQRNWVKMHSNWTTFCPSLQIIRFP